LSTNEKKKAKRKRRTLLYGGGDDDEGGSGGSCIGKREPSPLDLVIDPSRVMERALRKPNGITLNWTLFAKTPAKVALFLIDRFLYIFIYTCVLRLYTDIKLSLLSEPCKDFVCFQFSFAT